MILTGKAWKDGKFWLAEIPALDLVTQSKRRNQLAGMLRDAVRTLSSENSLDLSVALHTDGHIWVQSRDCTELLALVLRRQRQKHGLTLREAAARLGSKSPNAYARYENSQVTPSLAKLVELLSAIDPSGVLRIDWAPK